MKTIAIVPARSGSLRIPDKNIVKLREKTLLEHAVTYCKACSFDQIIVSSDSDSYLNSLKSFDISFHKRSFSAATSTATDYDVLLDICNSGFLKENEAIIAWVRPCSPFRSLELFFNSKNMLSTRGKGTIRSLKPITERPEWMVTAGEDFSLRPFIENGHLGTASNLLPELYIWSGQLDLFFLSQALQQEKVICEPIFGILDKKTEVIIDIDNAEQLLNARLLLDSNKNMRLISDLPK